MTNGSSQGLFIVIAVVIFGIFVAISYILYRDNLTPSLSKIFCDSFTQVSKQTGLNTSECSVPTEEEVSEYYLYPSAYSYFETSIKYSSDENGLPDADKTISKNFGMNYSRQFMTDEEGKLVPGSLDYNIGIFATIPTYSVKDNGYVYTDIFEGGSPSRQIRFSLYFLHKETLEIADERSIDSEVEVFINDVKLSSVEVIPDSQYFLIDVSEIMEKSTYNKKVKNNEIPRTPTEYFKTNYSKSIYSEDIFSIKYKGERVDAPMNFEIGKSEGTPG